MNDFQEIFAKNAHLIGEPVIELDRVKIVVGIDEDEDDFYWVLRDLEGKIYYTSMTVMCIPLFNFDAEDLNYLKNLFDINDRYREFPMFDKMILSSQYVKLLENYPEPTTVWVAYKNFEFKEFKSFEDAQIFSHLVERLDLNREQINYYENILDKCWSEVFDFYRNGIKRYLKKLGWEDRNNYLNLKLDSALELSSLVEDPILKSKIISNYIKFHMVLMMGRNV